MERLNVIAVPSIDLDGAYHTAFTVYSGATEVLRTAAGWTLRDAVEFYARDYGVQKNDIYVARPFVTQERHLRRYIKNM